MGSKARESAKAMSLAFVLLDFLHAEEEEEEEEREKEEEEEKKKRKRRRKTGAPAKNNNRKGHLLPNVRADKTTLMPLLRTSPVRPVDTMAGAGNLCLRWLG